MIWDVCLGRQQMKSLSVLAHRVVESQHISSTRDLVDTLEEHDVLESMLEDSKPHIDKNRHYLLFTPFRYPPLRYGSRFADVFEPSLWYGSRDYETALTEVAYYRLLFIQHTDGDLGYLEMPLTAFAVEVTTHHGIDLTQLPFDGYRDSISHKSDYKDTQKLGHAMRQDGVEAFLYFSARTLKSGGNIGVFTPKVFEASDNRILEQSQWLCIANKQLVEFRQMAFSDSLRFRFLQGDFADA